MTRRIAAFDFDGTITRRDTLLPFCQRVAGRGALVRALASLIRAGPAARRASWRDDRKADLLRAVFAGRDPADIATAGQRYATTLPADYRSAMLEAIEQHRRSGHELVLVTASLAAYAEPAGAALGFAHVIAVELGVDRGGRFDGSLARPNVRGGEKVARLRAWLGESADGAELWAYGNSRGDAALLAHADHPTWVGLRGRRKLPTR